MKLADVRFRDAVSDPDGPTPYLRFQVGPGAPAGAVTGMVFEAGLVTVTGKRGGIVVIPLSNVIFMRPVPPEAKK